MIITFFGHSNCLFNDDIKKQLKNILLDEIIKNPTCKFYLGGYGDFDGLCLRTLRELKHNFPTIRISLFKFFIVRLLFFIQIPTQPNTELTAFTYHRLSLT